MFQTELIVFLQSFSNDFFDFFFKLITGIGYESFIRPFLVVILFGISYKRGYILIQLVIWNELTTIFLKELFALPRPSNVDSRVQLLDQDYPNPTPLHDMGSKSFFGLLPEKAVAYVRTHRFDSYGFPSGHTSGAVSLFGGILLFFRKTGIKIICLLLIFLIPLSRMYLGRHFLADIFGGYLVGSAFLFIFYRFIFQKEKLVRFIFRKTSAKQMDLKTLLFVTYSFIVPLLLVYITPIDFGYLAKLHGLNIGFFLVWFRGVPDDEAPVIKRLMRVLIALIIFHVSSLLSGQITEKLFIKDVGFVGYIFDLLVMVVSIWGSIELNIKLRLFRRL